MVRRVGFQDSPPLADANAVITRQGSERGSSKQAQIPDRHFRRFWHPNRFAIGFLLLWLAAWTAAIATALVKGVSLILAASWLSVLFILCWLGGAAFFWARAAAALMALLRGDDLLAAAPAHARGRS